MAIEPREPQAPGAHGNHDPEDGCRRRHFAREDREKTEMIALNAAIKTEITAMLEPGPEPT
jgi:hypothetical protein